MSGTAERAGSATAPRVPSARRLEAAVSGFQQRHAKLKADPELAADEAVITSVLAEADVEDPRVLLGQVIDAAVWSLRRAEEAQELAAEYNERKQRYERHTQDLRRLIEELMQALDLTRSEGRLAKVSIVPGQAQLVVTDETQVPDEWFHTERSLRRRDLSQHIRETGEIVPGVELSNAQPMLRLTRLR
jgi:Siphovirus Gp157